VEVEYSFMFTQKQPKVMFDKKMDFFILDSGATSSATFCAADCTDIVPCTVSVNAAGGNFIVSQKGTAKFSIVGKSGKSVDISVADTLISEKFPFRLWALQSITNKGGYVTMKGECMSFFLFGVDDEFEAKKDAETRLFSIAAKKKKILSSSCLSPDKLRASSIFFSAEIFAKKISAKNEYAPEEIKTSTSSPATTGVACYRGN